MSLSLAVFILVVILVVGWFAMGTQYNVRKGHQAMRWLQDGLPVVGEKTSLRWLGSSVVELKVQQAKPPFQNVTILIVLEPRDVAPLWSFARLRGRRDLFIFRSALRKPPRMELEALDTTSWSTRGLARRLENDHWTPLSVSPPLVAYTPPQTPVASDLVSTAALDGCPLVRLAIRCTEPHLEVQWRLDSLRKHSAREVFDTIRRVAQRL